MSDEVYKLINGLITKVKFNPDSNKGVGHN